MEPGPLKVSQPLYDAGQAQSAHLRFSSLDDYANTSLATFFRQNDGHTSKSSARDHRSCTTRIRSSRRRGQVYHRPTSKRAIERRRLDDEADGQAGRRRCCLERAGPSRYHDNAVIKTASRPSWPPADVHKVRIRCVYDAAVSVCLSVCACVCTPPSPHAPAGLIHAGGLSSPVGLGHFGNSSGLLYSLHAPGS